MDDISDYIIQITCLNEDSLYEFLKNKLLSIDPRDFNNNHYFYDTRGFMRIKYVTLSNNGYLVTIPVKNGQTIRMNIDIKKIIINE